MADPRVSILMNCYNGETYLRHSIESVISQTFDDWELIFWDNRSTDASADIFKSYSDPRLLYFLSSEHTDLGNARALAIKHIRGEFVGILDTDDVWLPNKLATQIPAFDDKDVGIVISNTKFFNDKTEKILYKTTPPPQGNVSEALLSKYFVSLETVLLRKSFLQELPYMFDPEFSFIADFDLIFRVSQISKLAYCNKVLAKWRVHPNSESWLHLDRFSLEKDYWLKKQLKLNTNFKELPMYLVKNFKNKNNRQLAVMDLYKGNRINAIKSVINTGMRNWMDWLILCACFIPFSDRFLKWWKLRKINLS